MPLEQRFAAYFSVPPAPPRIYLDPDEAAREQAQKIYRHHVYQIPRLRVLGLSLIALFVLLHNLFILPTPSAWADFWRVLILFALYTGVSWLILLRWYSKVKTVHLGVCFLVGDIVLFLVAIYYSGGEHSWLFFLLMVRTADQTRTSWRSTLLFAHASTLGYVLLLFYLGYVEQRALSLPAALTKVCLIHASNIYLSFVAKAADDLRSRLTAAIRVARDLIRQLGEQSTALQASESDYRALVERSIQGLYIHQQRRIQLANPALAAIFGYASPTALIGQDYATLVAPHERARIESYRTARLQGQPAPDRYEYQGRRQDGTFVWLDCLVSRITWRGAPAILATLQDITARRQAEEALRESEARYRLLADNATDIIWVRDAHLRLLYITPSVTRVRGYSVEEAMAQSPEETLTPASFAAARQAWERWLQLQRRAPGTAPSMITLELEALCKDGSTVWLENRTSILRDATGRMTGFVGVNRDMTARKQAEEALQRAYAEMEARVQERTAALQQANSALRAEIAERQRTEEERQRLAAQLQQAQKLDAIGTLAGGIAHDFNNILTAILGYTELTLDDIPHESLAWHRLQSVLTAGQRAKDLVQQILTFSRHGSLERRPLQLDLLVREVLGLLRASLPTTIEIRSHLASDTGTVLANPTQMHQVLLNLCTNAEHAMRETGGVLEVSLQAVEIEPALVTQHMALPPGSYVQLTIRDTGHGMAPDVLERIFEPFFTTKGVGAGTGLGLSVVHGIIAEHHGAISIRSVVGQGTTCIIALPRLQHSAEERPQCVVSVPHGQGCILVVDDEAPLARLSQTMLERLGYDVVAYTSSTEALAAFRARPQHFDAVMTDQTMPHLSGEQLVQELRHIRPDVPIILCTGFSHVMDADKARALGIDAFCLKPFDAHDLERVLSQVMTKPLVQHS